MCQLIWIDALPIPLQAVQLPYFKRKIALSRSFDQCVKYRMIKLLGHGSYGVLAILTKETGWPVVL